MLFCSLCAILFLRRGVGCVAVRIDPPSTDEVGKRPSLGLSTGQVHFTSQDMERLKALFDSGDVDRGVSGSFSLERIGDIVADRRVEKSSSMEVTASSDPVRATCSPEAADHDEVLTALQMRLQSKSIRVEDSNATFDNLSLRALPVDPIKENYVRSSVPNSIFSAGDVGPDPLEDPKLVAWSSDALKLAGISLESFAGKDHVGNGGGMKKEESCPESMNLKHVINSVWESKLANTFGGNDLISGARPAAHCYCGYQFGSFSGQLGDGATMYLGEVVSPVDTAMLSSSHSWSPSQQALHTAAVAGEEPSHQRYEIQFKGAGKTPYSRRGDGRKVLRSSIREFLGSEAMHYLGIPTTRAGTIVTSTTTQIQRDLYYTGDVIWEQCSVVLRIAPTFFRFGSFEIFKPPDESGRSGPSVGNTALARQLLNFVVERYFPPHVIEAGSRGNDVSERAAEFLKEVVTSTANLVAHWQAVGFVHGVLNTDNLSIIGLNIDYGPFGFMEEYDPDYTPNGSDEESRYSYRKQPEICRWNCHKLAEALDHGGLLQLKRGREIVDRYFDESYKQAYLNKFRNKLGLFSAKTEDEGFIRELLAAMEETSSDFTNTFLALQSFARQPDQNVKSTLDALVSVSAKPSTLVNTLRRKVKIAGPSRFLNNPNRLLLLWEEAQNDPDELARRYGGSKESITDYIQSEVEKLQFLVETSKQIDHLEGLKPEGKMEEDREVWRTFLFSYGTRLAQDGDAVNGEARYEVMSKSNPRFILKNWILQDVIKHAESGNYEPVRNVLKATESCYDANALDGEVGAAVRVYLGDAPNWAGELYNT